LRYLNFAIVIILSLGVVWIFTSAVPQTQGNEALSEAPQVNFLAPDFSLPDASNTQISLDQLRGHPILINIWASWCPPCRSEMPAIERTWRAYKTQGFMVLGINATYQDSRENALAFTKAHDLSFPILLDTDGRVSRSYRLEALPTSFFVDREGVIREVVVGGPMSEALLRIRVEQLLKEKP
jgi:cytochrome c biogenesis protein CcmG/thiol:disulfide interchange protein DsbE